MENTCGAFIFNDEGRILIGHITNATRGSGGWSIPKGLVDGQETYSEAAAREVFEETGIMISPEDLSPLLKVIYPAKPKILHPFVSAYKMAGRPVCCCVSTFTDKHGREQPEIDDFMWATPIEAASLLHETQVGTLYAALELAEVTEAPRPLEVYDFDGTLVDTLGPERGIVEYLRVTDQKYPHKGWWSKPESLDPRLPFELILDVAEKLSTPGATKVVVTNRLMTLREQVISTLERLGVAEHVSHVNTLFDRDTKPARVARIAQAIAPTAITIFEDREDHIEEYVAHGRILGIETIINKVVDGRISETIHL